MANARINDLDPDSAPDLTSEIETERDNQTYKITLAQLQTLLAAGGGLTAAFNGYQARSGTFGLVLADAYTVIGYTGGGTITIPANATIAFPIGTQIAFMHLSGGIGTFSAAVGVTIRGATNLANQSGNIRPFAWLIKVGTNEWARMH